MSEEEWRLKQIREELIKGRISGNLDYIEHVSYLLSLLDQRDQEIDQRDRIIHDQTLDAQWAADAERGRIVGWLRERAKIHAGKVAGWAFDDAADELEAQGIPEPLPADILRERIEVLEAALQRISIGDYHEDGLGPEAGDIARKALEGKSDG